MIRPKTDKLPYTDKLSFVFPRILGRRDLDYSSCLLVTKSGLTRVCEAVMQAGT
jgi:hypothetical protein